MNNIVVKLEEPVKVIFLLFSIIYLIGRSSTTKYRRILSQP